MKVVADWRGGAAAEVMFGTICPKVDARLDGDMKRAPGPGRSDKAYVWALTGQDQAEGIDPAFRSSAGFS